MSRPTTIEVREATVGPLLGTMPVSAGAIDHIVVADADGLSSNLREHGVCALAKFGARYQHAHFSVRRYIDAGERIQIALAGAGESRAVIKRGDAHAALDWIGPIVAGKLRALGIVIAFRKSAIEQLIHDYGLAHHLFGCGGVAIVEKVSAPQLDRIEADGGGNFIHVALNGEDGLRRAEAAKRAVGNGVRGP